MRLTRRCCRPSLARRCDRCASISRHRLASHHRLAADVLFDDRVAPGIQRAEAQVLQLRLDQAHAQALGDRRVDVQGFLGDALARLDTLRAQRAHVVQAIGELDHDHAQVARHGQQHLAEALGRGFLAIAEMQLVQLGDAIDQLGDRFAEFGGDLGLGQRRVLDGVVQDRRDQGFHVQPQLGQDLGHRDRMGDVGLAGLAGLAVMRGSPHFPGTPQQRQLLGRQVTGDLLQLMDVIRHLPIWRWRMIEGLDITSWSHPASLCQRGNNGKLALIARSGVWIVAVASLWPRLWFLLLLSQIP